MTTNLETLFDFGCIEAITAGPGNSPPRLVERTPDSNGNLHEVFEVDGELVVVESWSSSCREDDWSEEEVTVELPVPQFE